MGTRTPSNRGRPFSLWVTILLGILFCITPNAVAIPPSVDTTSLTVAPVFVTPVDETQELPRFLLAQGGGPPSPDTVDFLRFKASANTYIFSWLNYTGFTSVALVSKDSFAAQSAIDSIDKFFNPPDTAGMKIALQTYLATTPPDEFASGVLYYYFNRLVDIKDAIHDPAEFASLMPAWSLLVGPNTKFMYNFAHIGLAWQAVAEGNGALALQYSQLVRDLSWQLILDYPDDPIQIWNVYNFLIASVALGESSVASALDDLRGQIDATTSTVLEWSAHHQIAAFSSIYPNIPVDRDTHVAEMLQHVDASFLQDALDRTDVMLDAKAMIEMMKGNVVRADSDYTGALAQYDSVLTQYPNRMEWVPRTKGRAIVNPSEYGVRSMVGFNRAEVRGLIDRKNPQALIAAYEEFVTAYPNSEYVDHAIWKLGRHNEHVGDLLQAKGHYESIVNDRPYSSLKNMAAARLAEVELKLATQ